MRFSIITPTYNSDQFIKSNISSVYNQNFKNYEHIIIDNISKDATIEIINDYKINHNTNIKIISEKDNGIYDAFNKGFKASNGEIISILNSDDYFFDNFILDKINETFQNNEIDFLYGNIVIVKRNSLKTKRIWKSSEVANNEFYVVPHPSFFVKRDFLIENNLSFSLDYKISSDLDFIIKCFKYSKKYSYLNSSIVVQRSGGVSQKFTNIFKSNYEVFKILKKNNIHNKISFILKKLFFKVRQLR